MDLIEVQRALDFISGAISSKGHLPMLSMLCLTEGRIQAFNGRIGMDAPCPSLALDAVVEADTFTAVVGMLPGDSHADVYETTIQLSAPGRKATLPFLPVTEYPRRTYPKDKGLSIPPDFFARVKRLRPFISTDASRSWSLNVRVAGGMAYATNNISIVRLPVADIPDMEFPFYLLDEIYRVGEPYPSELILKNGSLYLEYPTGEWIVSQGIGEGWPDCEKFFEWDIARNKLPKVPAWLIGASDIFKSSTYQVIGSNVSLSKKGLRLYGIGTNEVLVEGKGCFDSSFRAEILELVLQEATHVNFASYPGPCPFIGNDGLEGIVVGLRNG